MSPSVGQTLLNFHLVEKVGEGGMGEVWRAVDKTLGRDIALKLLPPAFAADPERMARFEREAKVLASLNHPGIAAIYGLHETDGVQFLVMEMVEGEDLSQRLSRGPLAVDEALPIARQIAEALEYAHEQGIVHRDLKPANVKITPGGAVKLLDFGLAKAIAGEPAPRDAGSTPTSLPTVTTAGTVAGIILGTAAYMSPEQARGKPVDRRTDIWAFGCVLYECLTGRRLFEGDTVSDVIAGILQTEPDWSRLPAATPSRIRTLLGRCLQRDAKERLRDIGEARIALTAPLDAPQVASPSPRTGGVPWWIAVAGAVLLAALAAITTLKLGSSDARPQVRKIDMPATDVDVDWNHAPVLSPDGGRIAYISKYRIWIRDLDKLAPRAVADITTDTPIGWSPDSRTIVYADAGKLWRVPVEGGGPTAICEIAGTGKIIGMSWSRSGVIAFAVWRGGLYRVVADGGAAEVLVDADPATIIDFHSPSWLANGDLLYVTHWKTDRDSSGKPKLGISVFDGKRQIPVAGDFEDSDESPIVASTGELLFLRRGSNPGIWAAPYEMKQHRLRGPAILVAPGASSISVSNDGSLLYIGGSEGEERRELVWLDRSGRVVEVLGSGHAGITGVALSPDGNRVAFSAQDGGTAAIWVRDLVRGTETRLTFDGGLQGRPAWLASSSRLAYTQVTDLQARVFAVNADGSGGQTDFAPATGLGTSAATFSVAPDGKRAVRIVDERGRGRLRIGPVLPEGRLGDLQPFLDLEPEPDVKEACISPDGRLLAYVTLDAGQVSKLFLTRFPNAVGRWQVSLEEGRTPRWAHDGQELFFIVGSGVARRSVVSVRVDSSQDPPIGEVTHLFDLGTDPELEMSNSGQFDVAADGRRFLFVRPAGRAGGASQRMVLVQNWRAEFNKTRQR
jgi:eukaryotic-like serine/threonine-protein kinase